MDSIRNSFDVYCDDDGGMHLMCFRSRPRSKIIRPCLFSIGSHSKETKKSVLEDDFSHKS